MNINTPDFSQLFEIEQDNIICRDIVIPQKKALIVNNEVINIVSDHYKLVQPKQVVENLIDSGVVVDWVKTNTSTGGLLVKSFIDTFDIDGEKHRMDLAFYTGHNSKYRTILSFQLLRHKCDNQIPVLMKNKSNQIMSIKHFHEFNYETMKSKIDEAKLAFEVFCDQYKSLKDKRMSKKQFVEFYHSLTNASDRTLKRIDDVYSNAKGQDIPDNAYKGLQAVTFDLTHNGRKGNQELENKNIKNMDFASKFITSLLEVA